MKTRISCLFLLLLVTAECLAQTKAQLEDATQWYEAGDWMNASKAYETLVRVNPYKGRFWYRRGVAQYLSDDLEGAVEAFTKSLDLGFSVRLTHYRLALCYTRLGQAEQALQHLHETIGQAAGMLGRIRDDETFAPLHSHEGFQALFGPRLPEDVSRTIGWRADLDYLDTLMQRSHFNLFRTMDRTTWERAVQRLHDRIPELDDVEVIGELMKLVARAGDGHTNMYPPLQELQTRYTFHQVPLRLYRFDDGLFVQAAAPAYAEAVGGRVIQIGSRPIEDLWEESSVFFGRDNDMGLHFINPVSLVIPELLRLLGAADTSGAVTYHLEKTKGARVAVTLPSAPLSFSVLSPLPSPDWITMRDGASGPAPLWLKHLDDPYWFEYLDEKKLVYFQFNQIRDKEEESLADFSRRLFAFIEANDVTALILDIRMNNGGNSGLNRHLVHEILKSEKINQPGRLFTIIGPRTFSAAQNLASDLESHTETLFVGEPTGSSPNHVGEDNQVVLPYSKLMVGISSRYFQRSSSEDRRLWIAPHIAAEMTSQDYAQQVDPALEAILAYLKTP